MAEERSPDWDWVKAVEACSAPVMSGTLKTLARQNVDARNAQLRLPKPKFRFHDEDDLTFTVNKPTAGDLFANQVVFKVTDDLSSIAVTFGRGLPQASVSYKVGLDDNGTCKLRLNGVDRDPWQVLKAALEPLLFG